MKREKVKEEVYENLPEELKKVTVDFKGREKDIVLLSSLGALSSCLPKVHGYYDGHSIYPHLYMVIIAPAASGKGVMNYSRILVNAIHESIRQNSEDQINVWKEKEKAAEKGIGACPSLEVKIMPANVSTSEMYRFLKTGEDGLLVMESEADTLSNMLKNDWSNYSDVLRKAYHHESVSFSRSTEREYIEIKEPKLGMVCL